MAQKYFRLFITLCCFLFSAQCFAQAQWRATLNFGSRPTPYLEEWRSNASIGTLTIFNSGSAPTQIIILFEVRNLSTNTVMLRGKSSPQNINAYPSPTILTNNNFIGSTGLQYNEAQKVGMLRTGMLPEGEYQICLAFESLSHQPILLAQNVCSNFSITYANAPQLVSPQDKVELEQPPLNFTWTSVTPPSGISVRYQLKVVEVLKGQSPTQALQSNTSFAEDDNISAPTFLLPTDKANLIKKGISFAWRVRAVDLSGRPFARNEGYSDIFIFSVKSEIVVKKIVNAQSPDFGIQSTVKGVLKYAYADPDEYKVVGAVVFPLKNMNVRLVMRQYKIIGGKKKFIGNDSTYASAKTDGAGNFSFSIAYNDTTKKDKITYKSRNSVFIPGNLQIFRKAFLIVDDWHYTSPDDEIKIVNGDISDAGELHCLLESFGLIVTVQGATSSDIVSGAIVDLYRYKKEDHIPTDEGSPKPITPKSFLGFPAIAEATTDASGNVSFGNMIQCYGDEQYAIGITPPPQFSGYQYPATFYPVSQSSGGIFFVIIPASPTMYSDYAWSQEHIEIAPQSITSGVKGKLMRGFSGSSADNTPLANTNVKLQIRYKYPNILPADFAPETYPDNGKIVAFGQTNANGDFAFSFNEVPKSSPYSDVARVYRVIVDDKHFTSPDDDIIVKPGQVLDAGTIHANIRAYNITFTTQMKDGTPMPGMYVYAKRPLRPASVPDDEGSPHPNPPMTRTGEDVVAIGLTDGNGNVTLSQLVRTYYDEERYHFETVSDPTTGKNYLGFTWDDFSSSNDNAEFNADYSIPTFPITIKLFPLPAQITGRVLRNDNNSIGIAGALITLDWLPEPDNGSNAMTTTSDKDGYYFIDGKYSAHSNVQIHASKQGYYDGEKKPVPSLNDGEQAYNDLPILPKGVVIGKVFHQWGSPQTGYDAAWVTVENGSSVLTASDFSLPTNLSEPSHVYFDPVDHSYFGDTLSAYDPQASSVDLGNVYLQKKLHRIKIVTIDEETQQTINTNIVATEMADPLHPGSVIPPQNFGGDTTSWFPFESSDQYFTFTTYTNTDADYEHRTYTISNPLSKDFIFYKLKTKKAGFIRGTVYLYSKKSGKKNTIDYAKIRLEQGSSQGDEVKPAQQPGNLGSNTTLKYSHDELLAYSGYSLEHLPGVYKLGNIPVGKHTFMGSKSKSGTIGEEKTLNVPKEGLTNVDFFLQVYEDMDITQMLGFPMDVTQLDSLKDGVFINGSFSELPASPHFKADQAEIGFTHISITPGTHKGTNGVPYPKPVKLPLVTDETSIPISYLKYNAQLKNAGSNITITSSPDEKGSISGKIYIPANQFSPKISFVSGKENGIYLGAPNQSAPGNMSLPVITADGKDAFTLFPDGLQIVDAKGGSGNYVLNSFNASFDASNSLLRGDSVTIATTLNLPDISNNKKTIPLSIGTVRLKGTDITIELPANATLPEIALDKWKLQGQKIAFSGDNLSMDGVLKTGSVDVPFTGLPITPQGWKPEQATFKLSSLSIASVIPLTLNSGVQFGHDIGAQPLAWQLYSTKQSINSHAASFAGINGIAAGDSIFVSSFKLTSLGSNSFKLQQNVYIHFYTYMSFLPQTLSVASGGVIEIKGDASLDLGNGLQASNRILSVSPSNGSLVFDPKKLLFDIQDYYQNGKSYYYASGTFMTFPASDQKLNEQGFFAKGTLIDQNSKSIYSFPVLLSRTSDSTAVSILPQNANGSPATFPISKDGTRYVGNIVGGMAFDYSSHQWSTLRFSGPLMGLTGAKSTMSFAVSGAVQSDDNQQIAVTNIPTPFGNGKMTFDFTTGAMHGSIDLNADLPGAGHMDGQADLEINKDGWYLAANGNLQLSNPNIGLKAALIFGDYPNILSITPITEKFDNLPWEQEVPMEMRTIPKGYNKLSGFFFAGDCTGFLAGINLPSVDVDLDPIVHCSVKPYYGAGLSLGMNFGESKQFDIGIVLFLGVTAEAKGSVGVLCGGGSLHFGENIHGIGYFNTSNGHWSITGGVDFVLSGDLYAGWGVCSDECGWITCDKHTWGPATLNLSYIKYKVGTDGVSISF